MPGVDAVALVARPGAPARRPAVLVLSAFADAPSARRAIEAGAIGWVLKDAEPDELVRGAARRRPASRPTAARPPPRRSSRTPAPDFGAALDARTVVGAPARASRATPAA